MMTRQQATYQPDAWESPLWGLRARESTVSPTDAN